jgi:V8-like Glu-specific endopeptidase
MAMHLDTMTSWRLGLLALLTATAGCAVPSSLDEAEEIEEVEGAASPIISGTTAHRYQEAALVNMLVDGRQRASCSGALIAPEVVLTAGHCVFGFNGWSITTPFAGGQKAMASDAATYDWEVSGEYVDPNYHDIGLVFLDRPIWLKSYPKITDVPVGRRQRIVNVGRIQDGRLSNSALFVSKPMHVSDGNASGFPHAYAASEVIQSGDSGGPDFLENTHTIVAVNSGAGSGTEVLARVDLLHHWIMAQVDAHGGAGPSHSGGGGGHEKRPNGSFEDEPNDSYEEPNTLTGTLKGKLSPGDEDWFSWSVSSARVPYEVSLRATGDAELRMWKLVGGRYYPIESESSTEIAYLSSGAGRYVVAAFSPSGEAQSYTISLDR